MATKSEWRPGPTVCRCCLAEGCYKDISTEYFWMGKREVYADMLSNTLNLSISYSQTKGPNSHSRLICEACISRLRDATEFKRQVEECERMFMHHLDQGSSMELEDVSEVVLDPELKLEDVKEERDVSDDEMPPADFGIGADDEDDDLDDEPLTKLATKLHQKDNDDVEDIVEISKPSKKRKATSKDKSLRIKITSKVPPKPEKKKKVNTPAKKKSTKLPTQSYIDLKMNTINLVLNSNLCLFKSLKTKYKCYHCKEIFRNILNLREHTLIHVNQTITQTMHRIRVMTLRYAEISNLSCTICNESCENLDILRIHLSEKHRVKFNGTGHLLIPFDLKEEFKCVICKKVFQSYVRLQTHMHSHFPANVCEICGKSYFIRQALRMHMSSNHTEKKCKYCDEKFKNAYLRITHMRKQHNTAESKRYCLDCGETFRYTYLLIKHRIQEHNQKETIEKCQECEKVFYSTANLNVHQRSVHRKERNFSCDICTQRFFTKFDLKRHEKSHTNERLFDCKFCDSKFKTKDSWRRHAKRLHNEKDPK